MLYIRYEKTGVVPAELQGLYTNRKMAEAAIKSVVAARELKKAIKG